MEEVRFTAVEGGQGIALAIILGKVHLLELGQPIAVVLVRLEGACAAVPRVLWGLAALLQVLDLLRMAGGRGGQDVDGGSEGLELSHHLGKLCIDVVGAWHGGFGGGMDGFSSGRGREGWLGSRYQDVMASTRQQWRRRR